MTLQMEKGHNEIVSKKEESHKTPRNGEIQYRINVIVWERPQPLFSGLLIIESYNLQQIYNNIYHIIIK